MCDRFTLRTPWRRLVEHFGVRVTDLPELFAPRFNVALTHQAPLGQPPSQFIRPT